MFDLSETARRIYRRLLGRGSTRVEAAGSTSMATGGVEAAASVEAQAGTEVRDSLAEALGLQASGVRAAALLSGTDLTASLGLLAEAVSRRLPLVVHLTADGDHAAYHAAAGAGAAQLFAADVQEAADLTAVARRFAEAALVPTVVAIDGETALATGQPWILPSPDGLERYLGAADELIHPPTASQEMLFGKHRRRVPRWHDPERPLLTGAAPRGPAAAAAGAARRLYFDSHLAALFDEAFEAFEQETGRRCGALRTHRTRGARLMLVAQGAAVTAAEAVTDRLREAGGPRVGVVGIRALRPFPAAELAELVRGRKVAVLERLEVPAGAETALASEVRSLLDHAGDVPRLTSVIYGLGGSALRQSDLVALCEELGKAEGEARSPIYLGLDTVSDGGAYPKREAHLDALRRAYPRLSRLGLRGPRESTPPVSEPLPPASVRRMGRASAPLADLPGFWDRVGVLYRSGEPDDLIPDPFLASAAVPPLAGALTAPSAEAADSRREANGATGLPAFNPDLCTGCGDCWSVCPEGAVGPVAIGAGALLETGMRLARERGRSVDKLRMVGSKLADGARQAVAAGARTGATAGAILDAAFEPLIDKMKLPDERAAAIREAYLAVREEVAALPLARTAPFFDAAGDFLTLAIDPDACTGCGLCLAACEPGALTAAGDTPERSAAARGLWRLADELPEPEPEVLERAREHPEVGPLAGSLLSRRARQMMAAVGVSEAGSGEVLAVRQVLGMAAAHLGPLQDERLAAVSELRSQLAAAIHEGLADALPDRDLDALARGLEALEQPDAELSELTDRVETAFETERVDVPRTRRLVEAARELADLEWRFATGEGGQGRSPFAVELAGSPARWAGSFPHNPFAVPATVGQTGDPCALARGLLEGQLRQTLEAVRTLRRARLELERASGRRQDGQESGELDPLTWETLGEDERRLFPPLLLLASEEALAGPALGGLLAALDTDLPFLVVAFHDPAGGRGVDAAIVALASAKVYVVQSSIAEPGHLGAHLAAALAHDGPAFLRLLAPSPVRAGRPVNAALELARAEVAAGRFPLFASDPAERAGRTPHELLEAPADAADAGDAAPAEVAQPVDADAAKQLEQRHAAEIQTLRAEYETRIAQLRSSLSGEMAQRIRGRLLQLISRAAAPAGAAATREAESGGAEANGGDGRPREAQE